MNPAPTPTDRFEIARTLRKIGSLLGLQGAPPFRARAYARGAAAVEAAEGFDRLLAQRRLTDLPGIGAGLAALIDELATTGRATLLDELESQLPPGAHELSAIVGLGPMRQLHEALGVDSIDSLEAACLAGRVRLVRGFGDKTEARLLEKIRAHRARGSEVLLGDARAIAAALVDQLEASCPGAEVVTVGAVRRGLELVPRIDLVARRIPSEMLAHTLSHHPRVEAVSLGASPDEPAASATLVGGLVIAVWRDDDDDALTLVTHTGPPEHVDAIRARLPAGHAPFASEVEVYHAAGLPVVPPELRDDPAALDPAAAAPRLLDATEIQGLVHCHTTWSDGRNSIAEMAAAAAARGLAYITFTDHSQAASYANGLDFDRMQRQWDEIDRVQASTPVRLLKGIESDILADGALDYPDEVLARLDLVIASIHARHAQSGPAMTERLLRMMRHPIRKIWGHPLGRLLQRRAPIECDVDALLATAAETGTIIELNGDPHRMDLPVEYARKGRTLGLRFVASVDAHGTDQLGYLDNAVTLARRAGLGPEHVLNTLPADAFVAAVHPTRAMRDAREERDDHAHEHGAGAHAVRAPT